ncbi:integrase [Streptococcus pneumoniae GA16242]|nr:integrase [Streptococcus pneumoniae GA16242]
MGGRTSQRKIQIFERYKDPYTEKLKKVVSHDGEENTSSKKSSRHIVAREDKSKIRGKQHSVSNITFEKLYEEFEENWKHGVKNSTVYASKNVKKRF